jgi:hypothetical protein
MAQAARFKVGSSGSGKHTEVQGDGAGMGGPASRPSDPGPRIGPGVLARVRPDYDRDSQKPGAGAPKVRDMKRYSEE